MDTTTNISNNNNKYIDMKAKLTFILNMAKWFTILLAVITAIIAGIYGIVYSLINSFIFIGAFVISVAGLSFGLITLKTIGDKLR